ncbi:PASTA domain protein [Paenibacillus konkukensis]|uniref:PASTA domain protein n=1 Tax=Paenibacillus konkukensis TaxID=2020716 RepID=A0ABY4RLR5_9BACL|nr:PASTA domain-containing protein [Paenibacillus konkukensis]UQZ83446.1 PASTA domain protein [Paenibacillus konkukensis]
MEDRMEQRYLPEQPILPLPGGMIYMGKDLSLNRKVILYSLDSPNESFTQTYTQLLGEASQFTDNSFMHILDIGFNRSSNRLIAVLKPCNGTLLLHEIAKQEMSAEEAITIVYELARGMQKAMEEGIAGFSVGADNVWLDFERRPVVMNYWEQGASAQRGTRGLSGLLLRMLSGSAANSAQPELDDPRVQAALRTIPAEQRRRLADLLRQTMDEDVPVKMFIAELRGYMSAPKEAAREIEPAVIVKPAITADARRQKTLQEEPARRPPVIEEEEEDEEDEEDEPRRITVGGVMKKTLLIGGAIVVIGICSVLILMGLFETLKPDKGGYLPPSSDASQTTPPAADGSGAAQNQNGGQSNNAGKGTDAGKQGNNANKGGTNNAGNTGNANNDANNNDTGAAKPPNSGPVQVPSLIGMTQDEAGKAAVNAGLRFYFEIEPNDMEQGKVFKQDLQAGQTVDAGTKVTFWVSKGKQ